jgi:hypothetical protein
MRTSEILEYVAKPAGDMVKLLILQYRDNFKQALEQHSTNLQMRKPEGRSKKIVISRLQTYCLEVYASLLNRPGENAQKLTDQIVKILTEPQRLTFKEIVEVGMKLEKYLYDDLQLTKIDTKEKIDRTRVENVNRMRG